MKTSRRLLFLACLVLSSAPLHPAPQAAPANPHLDLDFETADCMGGWDTGGMGYEVGPDDRVFRSGRRSLRMRYTAKVPWTQGPGRFGLALRSFPVEAAAAAGSATAAPSGPRG